MKLYDLLRTITHDNYTVYLQEVNFFNEERKLYNPLNNKKEILKNYLDYEVVSIDEEWRILIKSKKMI